MNYSYSSYTSCISLFVLSILAYFNSLFDLKFISGEVVFASVNNSSLHCTSNPVVGTSYDLSFD